MASHAHPLDFNRASFVALLFILGALSAGVFALIGLILAYAWSDRRSSAWELTHFLFLMRGFWLALLGNIAGFALMWVGLRWAGIAVLGLVGLWSLIRAIVSFAAATRRQAIDNPLTYSF